MPATDPAKRFSSQIALLALSLALLGASSMLFYEFDIFLPRAREVLAAKGLGNGYAFGNDFYQVWLASRECLRQRRDPYSLAITREIQIGLYGRPLDPHLPGDPKDLRAFPYPAFTEILFWPAAQFPFAVVRVAVVCLLASLTFASIALWTRALHWRLAWPWLGVLYLLILCSYPMLEGLYAAQLGLLVAFLLAASLLASQRGKLLLSGTLMALTTIKPQVTLLAILYLLLWSSHDWRKRGLFGVSFCLTVLLLAGGALVVWPHWIQLWLQVVVRYHGYTGTPLVNEILSTLLGTRAAGPATIVVIVMLGITSAMLAWTNRKVSTDSLEFWFTLSCLLTITTIALLPRQAVYDHGILLPGAFLVASMWRKLSSRRIPKAMLLIGAAVLVWPWAASFSLIVLRPMLTEQQFYSNTILALPLRTASAFPFVVLGLLVLAFLRVKRLRDSRSQSLCG